jgi:hypothetical protein
MSQENFNRQLIKKLTETPLVLVEVERNTKNAVGSRK